MRLSVRLIDSSQERYMLRVDLSELDSVDAFIAKVTSMIDPPIFELPEEYK